LTPLSTTLIHIVCDNVIAHKGKLVRAWLVKHPRFQLHFTPVHCSWMNQVEQWFSILQRKRLQAPNFDDLHHLEQKLGAFIAEWNQEAAPFNSNKKSFEKTLAEVDAILKAA
jgi:transposase